MDPQLTIDPCYTVTSKKFHILQNTHIPMTVLPPCQLTIDPCYTITPSHCQLTIDLCYTVTFKKFHILQNAHIPLADGPTAN